jgi:hypothetical protein
MEAEIITAWAHDGHGDEVGAVALLSGDHRKTIKRKHRGIAEMKQRQRRSQRQKRLAFEQHAPGARRLLAAVVAGAAGDVIVDRLPWDDQYRDDREHAENAGQNEHGGEPNFQPSQPDSAAPTILPA